MSQPIESSKPLEPVESNIVSYCESRRFMIDCFKAVNVPQSHAEQMAELLANADYAKNFRLGMNSLNICINDILFKRVNGAAIPKIIKETLATAWVDGENGLGAVVGNFCMDLAIKKAKECGLGWVCAKRSNFFGTVGFYTKKALNQGLIGISMSNTAPIMVPTRSKESVLGANPIAMAVPANDDKFCLDMATTAVAVGKIEIQRRNGAPMPRGWAQDEDGNVTTDAVVASEAKCLLPLGGSEETSGYKGYGLGALVDILSGVLSGANYSTKINMKCNCEANLGQLFIALDPSFFLTDFEERMTDFNSILRTCIPVDPSKPVLIAGDKCDIQIKETESAGGIEYPENQLRICEKLSTKFKVKPLRFL